MSIKLIAVDMDGTFLSDQKTYNRERFMAQYQQMKAQGIRFVVASGNQYYQLISFFPEIANEIAFVAENGGWVVSEGKDVFNGVLPFLLVKWRFVFKNFIDHIQYAFTVIGACPVFCRCDDRAAGIFHCKTKASLTQHLNIVTAIAKDHHFAVVYSP